jgi:tetratricopeptide (TPR) repeat protein
MPSLVRPSLRIPGLILLAFAVFGLAYFCWDRWANTHLYIDNALARGVNVELDGQRFKLESNAMHDAEVSHGAHMIVIRETDGKELERRPLDVSRQSLWDTIVHEHFYVYNIASQRVYRRAAITYAPSVSNSAYNASLVAMKTFFEMRDVDFAFHTAPETIEMSSSSSHETKIEFTASNDVTLAQYAALQMQQGNVRDARAAIAVAVANSPCDTLTRRMQLMIAPSASDAAKQWIAACRQDDLQAHRAYQDANRWGHRAETRAEYAALLAQQPDSGKMHYLYGRTLDEQDAAIVEYRKALALTPDLVWARIALGYANATAERYDDALREYGMALDEKGVDDTAIVYYAYAAMSAGHPEAAEKRVDMWRKSHPRNRMALHARWLLAASTGDRQKASELQAALEPLEDNSTRFIRKLKTLRLANDHAVDRAIDAAIRDQELHADAVAARAIQLIVSGDYAAAAELVAKNAKTLDPLSVAYLQLYAAGGMMLAGDDAAANATLDAAAATLHDVDPRQTDVVAQMLDAMRGKVPVERFKAFAAEQGAIEHAWFVTAVRAAAAHDNARAAVAFDNCARTATELDLPYAVAKAMRATL